MSLRGAVVVALLPAAAAVPRGDGEREHEQERRRGIAARVPRTPRNGRQPSAGGHHDANPARPGRRPARNARRPSWPSALARLSAIRRAVSSSASGARASVFATRAASGPAVSSSPTTRSTARVEVVGELVDEPDPQRGRRVEALAGHEVPPRAPSRRSSPSTNGEITPGTIPSFTSLNANAVRGLGDRRRRSTRRGPRRRRTRGPARGATTGAGQPSTASSIAPQRERVRDVLVEARARPTRASTRRRAPAQNDSPSPASTTARASPTSANAAVSSAISAASNAFRRSGRARVTRSTGPSRSTSQHSRPSLTSFA